MSFEVSKINSCVIFKTESYDLGHQDHAKALFDELKKMTDAQLKENKWIVFDLNKTKSLHPNMIPMLCRISSYIEQSGLKFAIVAESRICELILKNGIERMVLPYTSLDAFNKLNGIHEKENVKTFLNTLLDSVMMSMKVLIETEITKTTVTVVKDISTIPVIQAGAMAGILSAYFSGNIVIGFTSDVFKKVMSIFLQMEIEVMTPEIADGAAELLNVIIGQTKIKLNERGFDIRQVIPNVITGEKILISPSAKQTCVLIACQTKIGDFTILLTTNATH